MNNKIIMKIIIIINLNNLIKKIYNMNKNKISYKLI